jgi:hypothetical protein
MAMRAIEWAFVRKTLRRIPVDELQPNGNPKNGANRIANEHITSQKLPPCEKSPTLSGVLWDAFKMFNNQRGHGWNWARSQSFPPETRPTSPTSAFLASTLVSAIKHILIFDLMLTTIRSFSPLTFGSPIGGTIYDPSLPPYHRYAQSTFITLAAGITIYTMVQFSSDMMTILCITIFQQHPTQWPPLFDSPWYSTSLADFWGRRWHQMLRGIFIDVGARPLSFLIGRIGGVMGAFICSAILHSFGLWGMGRESEFWSIGLFYLMQGVGCILEALFTKATGRKVGGWAGWLWTMSWIVGWGSSMVDAYARLGLIGSKFVPEEYLPSQILVSYLKTL